MNEGNKGASIWDTFSRQPGKKSNLKGKTLLQKLIYTEKTKNNNLNPCIQFLNTSFIYVTTGRILDFSNADVAVDQYHRFKVHYKDTFVGFRLHFLKYIKAEH